MPKNIPLFAANLPLSRIEYDAYAKLPRRDVPIVTLDEGEGFAELAARRLIALGYSRCIHFPRRYSGMGCSGR